MKKIEEFGGLNETGTHRIIYLNVHCPVTGTVWKGLRSMALSEWSLAQGGI